MSTSDVRLVFMREPLGAAQTPPASVASGRPTSPGDRKGKVRKPGWKPVLVRQSTFKALQELQKATTDPKLDLSYLADAVVRLGLEKSREEVVVAAIRGIQHACSQLPTESS